MYFISIIILTGINSINYIPLIRLKKENKMQKQLPKSLNWPKQKQPIKEKRRLDKSKKGLTNKKRRLQLKNNGKIEEEVVCQLKMIPIMTLTYLVLIQTREKALIHQRIEMTLKYLLDYLYTNSPQTGIFIYHLLSCFSLKCGALILIFIPVNLYSSVFVYTC